MMVYIPALNSQLALEAWNSGGTTPVTPAAPRWAFDPQTRVLSLTHPNFPASQLEYLYQGGAYQAYTASLSVDGNAHQPGEWLGRVKEAAGRTASQVAESPQIMPTPATGWDGRDGYSAPFGDSRVANEGFDGATGKAYAWPKLANDRLNTAEGAGHYEFENLGNPSQGTDQLLMAVDIYVKQRYDPVTYWAQVLPVLAGVNDRLHHPDWDVSVSIEYLKQIHLKLHAAGLPTIACTEFHSYAFTQYPDWFRAYNDAIKAHAVSEWGCESVCDLENFGPLSNMLDKAISPDNLHLTSYGNTLLADAIMPYLIAFFMGRGMPTPGSGGSGGMVTPATPTISLSGRTFTATPGNGLASSTLRYKVQGGAEQTGNSYTVPNASSLAAGELAFYTVATGNYNKSGSATNTQAVAAVPVGYVIDPGFNMAATQNIETGWQTSTDYGDNKQQVEVVGDGFARFKSTRPYDTLSTKAIIPGGNQKVIAKVTAIADYFNILESSGAGLFFKTIRASELPANGWVEIPFTSAGQQPVVLQAKSENGSLFDLDYFDIVPA